MANQDLNTLEKLLEFRNYLFFSDDIRNFEKGLHGHELNSFVHKKVEISAAISKLENKAFQKVEKELELQDKNLEVGIEHLEAQLKAAVNFEEAFASLNSILSILNGVLSIVK